MDQFKKRMVLVFGGMGLFLAVLIITAWLTHPNTDVKPELYYSYKKGDVVYLKPDSMTAVITGTHGGYYRITRPEWRGGVSVRDFEIYGIKK